MSAETSIGVNKPAIVGESVFKKVARDLRYAEELTWFIDRDHNLDKFALEIAAGKYPIIVSNHTHHINIAAMNGVVKRLRVKPKDFYLVVALSLLSGDQERDKENKRMREFAIGMQPVIAESGITHVVPVLRPKDRNNFYKDRPEDLERDSRRSVENIKILLDTVSQDQDAGVIIFPEGTIEGGRKDENGRRNGLQRPGEGNVLVPQIIARAYRQGREVVILPVGMVNANNIAEADSPHATTRAKLAIGVQATLGRVGIKPKVAKVIIGEPYTTADMIKKGIGLHNKDLVNSEIMVRIAKLLPFNARGYLKHNKH